MSQQPRYQPIQEFTYWPLLGCFNNWNIIKFTNKNATSENFEAIHKDFLDDISDDMSSLVQPGKYSNVNKSYLKRMGRYVVNSVLYTYKF